MHDSGSSERSWFISGSLLGFVRDIVVSYKTVEVDWNMARYSTFYLKKRDVGWRRFERYQRNLPVFTAFSGFVLEYL